MTQMAMSRIQPMMGIHERSAPTSMIQNHEVGLPAILIQIQRL